MKKLLAIILSILMLTALVSCTASQPGSDTKESGSDSVAPSINDEPDKTTPFKITVISGTTGMGFAQMMDNAKKGTALFPYTFDVVSGADVVAPAIINGTADIAAVPTNLAAVLYQKTKGEIQILATNTQGVLYLIENGETVNSMADLSGKTVYCCQQGANPEYITSYLLKESGLEVGKDVFLDFTYNSPDELATAIATGAVDLAVLPEPKVTATLSQNESLRRAINFSDVWKDVTGGLPLIQGVIVGRKSFIEAHPAEVALFVREYNTSIEFVNRCPEDASKIIEEFGIIPKAALALKAIPNCNIAYSTALSAKDSLMGFFSVLHEANPASVGGQLPDEGIIYTGK